MDPDLGSKSTELSTAAACRWASAGGHQQAEQRQCWWDFQMCSVSSSLPRTLSPPPPSSCNGPVGLWRGAGGGERVWLCPGGDLAKLELNARVWQQEGSACGPEARGVASGRAPGGTEGGVLRNAGWKGGCVVQSWRERRVQANLLCRIC